MGELKPGWRRVKFGEMVRLNRETCKAPAAEGIERYIGLEHLEPGDLRVRSWGDVSEGTTFTNRVRPGQVLFGKRRAYQRKVALADFDAVCSGDIYVFESANPEVLLPGLLPFLCQTDAFFERAVGTSAGSLSPRTNWTSLASYEFALPPLEEQRRLLRVLDASQLSLDCECLALSEAHSVRMSIIKRYSDSVEGATRTNTRLSSLCVRIEPGDSPQSSGQSAGVAEFGVLKVSAVGDWVFNESENKLIERTAFKSYLEVKSGDFLVARANADPNSVGRTCIVESTRPGLMLSDKTWRMELTEECQNLSVGVLAWTKSPVFRRHIRNQLNGTEAKNISQERFLAAPAPPIDERFIDFARQIELINTAIFAIQRRVSEAQNIYAILLREASGQ